MSSDNPGGSRFAPTRTLATADQLRLWWLRRLGTFGSVLVRQRELRVATIFSTVIVLALIGTLVFPLWLLVLGPVIWGAPHLVADLRYLVVRPGFAKRRPLWVLAGVPLLVIAVGGPLIWGFVGAAAVACTAKAPGLHRLVAAALFLVVGAMCFLAGPLADIVFGHVHNFLAVGLWWLWRRRRSSVHRIPLALLLAAAAFLLSPYAAHAAGLLGSLGWHASGHGPDFQLWRLAPGLAPDIGLRLVLLFCFMQSVHYAVWMVLVPDEERPRATVMTFRASYEDLRRDLGTTAIVVTSILALGIAGWAVLDLADAGRGYFRMARFHGHLELMAGALLVLESRRARPDSPCAREP